MNTLLKQTVTSHTGRKEGSTSPHCAPAISQTVRPRARILYVEDEPQIRRLGELVLVRAGYDVHTAADGAEGWQALQHTHYNLLITDNDMPRLTGLELIRQSRLAGMRLPIVLATGSAHVLRDSTASSLELTACLPKPFAAGALVEIADRVLHIANRKQECTAMMISLLAHIARVQPVPHGGINE